MYPVERTIEDGVGNQTARIICPIFRIDSKRLAIAATKSARIDVVPLQLTSV
jgi:hypothetical protein